MDKYSVSIVYTKDYQYSGGMKTQHSLRVLITDAVSEAESLGLAIAHFKKEKSEWSIYMHVVIKIEETTKPNTES
jgi:hypothetical protein